MTDETTTPRGPLEELAEIQQHWADLRRRWATQKSVTATDLSNDVVDPLVQTLGHLGPMLIELFARLEGVEAAVEATALEAATRLLLAYLSELSPVIEARAAEHQDLSERWAPTRAAMIVVARLLLEGEEGEEDEEDEEDEAGDLEETTAESAGPVEPQDQPAAPAAAPAHDTQTPDTTPETTEMT